MPDPRFPAAPPKKPQGRPSTFMPPGASRPSTGTTSKPATRPPANGSSVPPSPYSRPASGAQNVSRPPASSPSSAAPSPKPPLKPGAQPSRVSRAVYPTAAPSTPAKPAAKSPAKTQPRSLLSSSSRSEAQPASGSIWYSWLWAVLRPVLIFTCAAVVLIGIGFKVYDKIVTGYVLPVNPEDHTLYSFQVKRGWTLSKIATELHNYEFVRNKAVFHYYAEFTAGAGRFKAGTFELARDMDMDQLIDVLSRGDGDVDTVNVALQEGWTIDQMVNRLVAKKVLTEEKAVTFRQMCVKGEEFIEDYSFLRDIAPKESDNESAEDGSTQTPSNTQRRYLLEGYLFPDTYNFETYSEPDVVIRKLLSKTESVLNSPVYDEGEDKLTFIETAKKKQMTIDQMITLASMIEKEGKRKDFAKVSAVFHNRLKSKDMKKLQSCPTVQYVLNISRLVLTDQDIGVNSPYNTYQVEGLPLGPISNPSLAALRAALYPDADFIKEKYLYFCSTDPNTGDLAFSKTLAEHTQKTETYRPMWKDWDNKNAGGN